MCKNFRYKKKIILCQIIASVFLLYTRQIMNTKCTILCLFVEKLQRYLIISLQPFCKWKTGQFLQPIFHKAMDRNKTLYVQYTFLYQLSKFYKLQFFPYDLVWNPWCKIAKNLTTFQKIQEAAVATLSLYIEL
jgi:hypothetical protein